MVKDSNIMRRGFIWPEEITSLLGELTQGKGSWVSWLAWFAGLKGFLAKADPSTRINKPGVGSGLKTSSMTYGENYNRL